MDTPAHVLLISTRLWQRRFASDPNVIGKTVLLDGVNAFIIGVMPPGFRFTEEEADYWAPLRLTHFQLRGSAHYLAIAARLKPGVSIAKSQADMDAINAQLAKDFPDRNQGCKIRVQPIHEGLFGWMRQPPAAPPRLTPPSPCATSDIST